MYFETVRHCLLWVCVDSHLNLIEMSLVLSQCMTKYNNESLIDVHIHTLLFNHTF